MISLMTKNLGKYVFAPLVVITWIVVYGTVSGVNHIVEFSTLLGILVFFAGVLPAVMVEVEEERNRGYEFLATLPVEVRTVVRAKGLMLAADVVLVLLVEAAFISFNVHSAGSGADVLLASLSRVLFGASVCLVLGGAALVAIYRFGTFVVLAGFGTITLILNIATFLLFRLAKGGVRLDIEGGFLSRTGWIHMAIMAAAAVVAYRLLLEAAVRVKQSRRV